MSVFPPTASKGQKLTLTGLVLLALGGLGELRVEVGRVHARIDALSADHGRLEQLAAETQYLRARIDSGR